MGSHPFSEHSSYITGVSVCEDEGWLVMAMDHLVEQDSPHSVFVYLKSSDLEMKHMVTFKTRFAGVLPGSESDLVVVSDDGDVAVVSRTGSVTEDVIAVDGVTPAARGLGPLRSGAIVDGRVVIVGWGMQVYCREPTGEWVTMERGLPSGPNRPTGFEDVAGSSLSSLYAAGWEGKIWKYDGSRWSAMASPTRCTITAVCVADDGSVYAVGQMGALYRATNDQWAELKTGCYDDLWSVTCFEGEIYAASLFHLYKLNPAGELDMIDPFDCLCFGPFSKTPDTLWTIGQKAVLSYRAGDWNHLA